MSTPNEGRTTAQTRPVSDYPDIAEKALHFLRQCNPKFQLSVGEAGCIVELMRLVNYQAGASVFRAGEVTNTGFMLLVLEGDISVDTGNVGGGAKVDVSVLGPGTLIGELSLIDGAPRSANCTAVSAVTAAGLSVGGLQRLTEQHPKVAAKLAIFIAQNAADRLRGLSEQLQMYDQLTSSLLQEVAELKALGKR
jgi:CRP/FNR family transcriptional regulator, cyclic AMP receptor protein